VLAKLSHVHRRYGAGPAVTEVLKGVTLAIEAGQFLAIMGPSGSGKSTLLHILGCLDRPTSGTVTIDGVDVSHLDDATLSSIRNRRIGFVFQAFHLIPRLSVLDNIAVPLLYARVLESEARARALEAARAVGLAHRGHHVPAELSGGECQRVAIARALINDPALILADEPTGNLDSATGGEVLEVLRGLHARGKAIVSVTHNQQVAAHAERIIVLEDGRIAA